MATFSLRNVTVEAVRIGALNDLIRTGCKIPWWVADAMYKGKLQKFDDTRVTVRTGAGTYEVNEDFWLLALDNGEIDTMEHEAFMAKYELLPDAKEPA